MKRIPHVLTAIAALLCASARAETDGLSADDERIVAALPAVPPGLNGGYDLEVKPAARISAVYTYTVNAPDLTAKEWELFLPRPQDFPGQKILRAGITPENSVVADLSPLGRPLMRRRVTADTPLLAREITLEAKIQATLFSRRLVARSGGGGNQAPALADRERRLFLRCTPQFDHTSEAVRQWMVSNRLKRGVSEGEVDFARRVFQVIAKGFHYEYLGEQDRSAASVCVAGKSDCGGMAVLFVTALRVQGIPARALAGRWAQSAKPDDKIGPIKYYQEHVKAEFFAQGVGWVPADLSSAVLHDPSPAKLEFFGNDRGDFLTFHLDNDLIIDTLHFGVKGMPWLQDAAYWVTGTGSVTNAEIRQSWSVTNTIIPPASAR